MALLSALFCGTAAFSGPQLLAPRASMQSRAAASMQLDPTKIEGVITFDQDGVFSKAKAQKPALKLLSRLESLKLLSGLAEAGVLSSAEEAGVFSKLEAAGAFSTLEGLLPLADDLKLLSLAEGLINVDSGVLLGAGLALLAGEVGLIYVVPDDNVLLVGLQAATGVAAGAASITLLGASYLFGLLQEA